MSIFMSQRKVPNHVTQVPSGPLERGRGAAEAGALCGGGTWPGLGGGRGLMGWPFED